MSTATIYLCDNGQRRDGKLTQVIIDQARQTGYDMVGTYSKDLHCAQDDCAELFEIIGNLRPGEIVIAVGTAVQAVGHNSF